MTPKIIGSFPLGHEYIDIAAHNGYDGEFQSHAGKGKCARISVGISHKNWHKVVDVLLHELMEYAMWRDGLRYDPDDDVAQDAGAYLFVMRHDQFSNAIAKVGMAAASSHDELKKEWERVHKKSAKDLTTK